MRENAWKKYDEAGLKEVFEYCEGYKKYISDCKTERECVSESIRIAETYGGMINAIGLQNPGLDTFISRDIPFLKQYDTKIIVNVCGKTEEDYVDAVEK